MIFQTARSNLHHGSNAAEPQLQHPEYRDASPCHGGGPDDCAQRTGTYPQLEVLHVLHLINLCLSRQEAQQSRGGGLGGPAYSFGGFTPQAASGNTPGNLLSTGQTPHNMLGR